MFKFLKFLNSKKLISIFSILCLLLLFIGSVFHISLLTDIVVIFYLVFLIVRAFLVALLRTIINKSEKKEVIE